MALVINISRMFLYFNVRTQQKHRKPEELRGDQVNVSETVVDATDLDMSMNRWVLAQGTKGDMIPLSLQVPAPPHTPWSTCDRSHALEQELSRIQTRITFRRL